MKEDKRNVKKMLLTCLCVGAVAAAVAALPAVTNTPDVSIEANADYVYVPITVPTAIPTEVPTEIRVAITGEQVWVDDSMGGHYEDYYEYTSRPTVNSTVLPTTNTSFMSVYVDKTTPSAVPSSAADDKDSDDKVGWGGVSDKIKDTPDGGVVDVDMNGQTKLPQEILSDISGRDIDLILDMGDGITWTINGNDVTDPNDIDFGVDINTSDIPADVINNVTGEKNTIQISLKHNGEFGFTATLTIDLGASNNGFYANLFYYNPETGKLEFVDYSKIDGGKADLVFTHASDWAIVIDKEPLGATEDASTEAGITADGNSVEENGYVFVIPVIAAAVLGVSAAAFRKKARR
ncbi:MAG: hypothetical protein ACI4SF_07875 [Oscillospiraceae bacterium]